MSTKRKAGNLLFVDVSMDPKYTSTVLEHLKLEKFDGIAHCHWVYENYLKTWRQFFQAAAFNQKELLVWRNSILQNSDAV